MHIFGYKLCIFLDAYNFVGLKTDKNDKIRNLFADRACFCQYKWATFWGFSEQLFGVGIGKMEFGVWFYIIIIWFVEKL